MYYHIRDSLDEIWLNAYNETKKNSGKDYALEEVYPITLWLSYRGEGEREKKVGKPLTCVLSAIPDGTEDAFNLKRVLVVH